MIHEATGKEPHSFKVIAVIGNWSLVKLWFSDATTVTEWSRV